MARRSLKYNAAILTATGFVVKILGFFYRIFIANRIGAEGLGLYQLMTPIYSLLVLVLSAGVSTAVSRFVAEESSKSTNRTAFKIASVAAGLVLGAGIIICGILLLNLDTLVFITTNDARTKDSLFWILILVPPIAAVSAYKGYFYGKQEMIPNSIAQIIEQMTKLVFIILMYDLFKGKGADKMCLLAVIALLIGECANILTVYIAFEIKKRRSKPLYNADEKTKGKNVSRAGNIIRQRSMGRFDKESNTKDEKKRLIKQIGKVALPLSVNRLLLSTLGTIENLIIPKRLVLHGLSPQQSLEEFGRLTGMASPLVFFPSMLPMALATALVPAIASAIACRKFNVANRQISQSIRLTLIMGLIFTAFFTSCAHELAELVYPGKNVGAILRLYSITGVFIYLQQTMLGILNGLSKERAMLTNTLAGSLVRLLGVWLMIPVLGVNAYVYAVIAGSGVTIVLNFITITKLTGISIDIGSWVVRPLSAALIGIAISLLLKSLMVFTGVDIRISYLMVVAMSIVTIVAIYLIMGIIKREDIERWFLRRGK